MIGFSIKNNLWNRQETYLAIFTLLGFSLALLAAMTWGSLPVAAQQALKAVDAPTLVWARFLSASLVLLVILASLGAYWFFVKLGYDHIHFPFLGDVTF